jgi:hypothetical protein
MPIYIFYGNWSSQTFRKYSAVPGFGGIGFLEINILPEPSPAIELRKRKV